MLEATAYLETESARKYLAQLCKHFAHNVEVSYSENHGECRFSCGESFLDAEEKGLRAVVRSADEARLSEAQSIIESHLLRFAFREEVQALDWQRRTPAA